MKNKKILFLLLILCLFTTCLLFATAEEANIEDTPPEPKLVLQENNIQNNENIELNKEKFEFQTEVSRLMKLIINSLYKTREIFLRELISNASDAIDKIRFLALTQPDALSANPTLNISIWADKENKILTIADSGIGMTKKQLIENLGTIARSGTSEFLDALEDKKADVSLIGQFGVGFYSVFLVADRVTVITKNNDDKQYIWESNAISDFTIAEDPNGNTLGRGTQIRLHLKDDALEFLEDGVLRGVILRYSEFINFPIWLWTTKTETVEVDDNSDDDDGDDDKKNEEPDVDSDEEPKKDKPKKKTKVETVEIPGWELMNTQKPIWTRDPKNVTEIEYENFYSSFAKDPSPPLAWNHFKAEGEIEFRAIIYIPSKAPSDLFQKVQDFTRNVKLFVKRVFITDEFLDFVPKYLQFIRAIIDAEDLPLNVSRETLQQHRALRLIKKRIVKKTFELLASLSKDDEKYKALLKEFGISLKVGAIEDNDNRKKIAQLLKFPSSYNDQNWTTLDAYISRMKKGQDKMYFITGSSIEEASQSPFVEGLVARGYEVLYMVEPIDEMLVQHMPGHGGKVFLNIAKGDFDFGNSEDKEEASNLRTKFSKLTSWMLSVLSQSVEKVEVSKRLTTSPCAVVASEWGWTGHMEQIMKAQAIKQDQNPLLKDFYEKQKRILEINPNHPLILGLLDQVENDSVNDNTKEMVNLLYETTLIRSGYSIRDNLKYASMVEKMLRTNLGIDLNSKPEINIEPAQDKDEDEEVESSKKVEDLFKELEDDYINDDEKTIHEEL